MTCGRGKRVKAPCSPEAERNARRNEVFGDHIDGLLVDVEAMPVLSNFPTNLGCHCERTDESPKDARASTVNFLQLVCRAINLEDL